MDDSAEITVGKSKIPYTILANALLRDDSITLEARGLMANLLSNAEGWKISVKAMTKYLFNPSILGVMKSGHGKTQIYRIMDELMLAGYLERTVVYKDGRVEKTLYTLHPEPLPLELRSKKVGDANRKPVSRKPESSISENSKPEQLKNYQPKELTTERSNNEKKGQAPTHAPASIDDLLPQDDLYRDGMTKAEYIEAKEAEQDQLAPYEKAIRAVIAQARLTGDNFTLLGDTAKAYRDAGLTPEDIRRLWSTNSDSFWKAHTSGGSKPNSGKPWLGNVSGELSRAVEFLENQAGATEATALYRQWIAPLAEMNGSARDFFRGAPSQVKRALSANGMGSVEQIKRVSEQDFAGWYAGVK
jgi:hypothetical protein